MLPLISDKKYDELKNVFSTMSPKQAFVVAAFALERLWEPFVDGISDCAYTEQERQEVLKLEKQFKILYGRTYCLKIHKLTAGKSFVNYMTKLKSCLPR